ncbi:hypothetical protein K438DRAFT_1763256 [Mycena galopus ATCC 62051]|nr:hypothetical protein K438DRAFT_1763256 [Mycena galopus ATCC 62051]
MGEVGPTPTELSLAKSTQDTLFRGHTDLPRNDETLGDSVPCTKFVHSVNARAVAKRIPNDEREQAHVLVHFRWWGVWMVRTNASEPRFEGVAVAESGNRDPFQGEKTIVLIWDIEENWSVTDINAAHIPGIQELSALDRLFFKSSHIILGMNTAPILLSWLHYQNRHAQTQRKYSLSQELFNFGAGLDRNSTLASATG